MSKFTRSALGGAIAAGMAFAAAPANAAYVVNFTEVGSTVVMTSSGSVNTAALTKFGAGSTSSATIVGPNTSLIQISNGSVPSRIELYSGFTGPTSFGPSSATSGASTIFSHAFLFSGSSAGASGDVGRMGLPENYVSGTALGTNTATFNGSFASLGLTRGTYNWTWGTGATADSFTVNIGPAVAPGAVPEPATWAMLILGFGAVGGALRRRKRPALKYC